MQEGWGVQYSKKVKGYNQYRALNMDVVLWDAVQSTLRIENVGISMVLTAAICYSAHSQYNYRDIVDITVPVKKAGCFYDYRNILDFENQK